MSRFIVNAKNVGTLERIVFALVSIISGVASLLLAPFGYSCSFDIQVSVWMMSRMVERARQVKRERGDNGKS